MTPDLKTCGRGRPRQGWPPHRPPRDRPSPAWRVNGWPRRDPRPGDGAASHPPGAQSAHQGSTGGQDVTGTSKGRPTLYKGIRMRSRLEADYAAYLDHEGRAWEYEPECFASADGQWLPDFRVTWAAEENAAASETLLELKPAGRLYNDIMGLDDTSVDKYLTQMAIAWASKPAAELMLVYWQYGGPAVMQVQSYCQGAPWLAKGSPLPLLWTGMGQYDRCDLGRQVSSG